MLDNLFDFLEAIQSPGQAILKSEDLALGWLASACKHDEAFKKEVDAEYALNPIPKRLIQLAEWYISRSIKDLLDKQSLIVRRNGKTLLEQAYKEGEYKFIAIVLTIHYLENQAALEKENFFKWFLQEYKDTAENRQLLSDLLQIAVDRGYWEFIEEVLVKVSTNEADDLGYVYIAYRALLQKKFSLGRELLAGTSIEREWENALENAILDQNPHVLKALLAYRYVNPEHLRKLFSLAYENKSTACCEILFHYLNECIQNTTIHKSCFESEQEYLENFCKSFLQEYIENPGNRWILSYLLQIAVKKGCWKFIEDASMKVRTNEVDDLGYADIAYQLLLHTRILPGGKLLAGTLSTLTVYHSWGMVISPFSMKSNSSDLVVNENILKVYEWGIFNAAKRNDEKPCIHLISTVINFYREHRSTKLAEGEWHAEFEKTALEHAILNNNPNILKALLQYRYLSPANLRKLFNFAYENKSISCYGVLFWDLHQNIEASQITDKSLFESAKEYLEGEVNHSHYKEQIRMFELIQSYIEGGDLIISPLEFIATEERRAFLRSILDFCPKTSERIEHLRSFSNASQALPADANGKVIKKDLFLNRQNNNTFASTREEVKASLNKFNAMFLSVKTGSAKGEELVGFRLYAYIEFLKYLIHLLINRQNELVKEVLQEVKNEAIFSAHRNTSTFFHRTYAAICKTSTIKQLDTLESLAVKGQLTGAILIRYRQEAETKPRLRSM